jgi:hypothetical protein
VPFEFLRRGKKDKDAKRAEAAPGGRPSSARGIAFDGLTEEWRLTGLMQIEGRLSDALNKRHAVPITEVRWAPVDGSGPLTDAPGLKSIDPYDLIVVLAGEGSQPPLSEEERAAFKVHKIAYDVALEVPPFRIFGTVYLYPGSEPDRLLDRATEMFLPVTDAEAMLGDRPVGDPEVDTLLVNRFYLRGVTQVDKRTREPAPKLPGQPLGGISWQDRSR